MKQSMLALAIPALLAVGTAQAAVIYQADDGSNVDLYGRLGFNISDKKSGNDQGDFDGRIGFTARQTVNEQVAVIGMAQYQVNAAEYANNVQKNSSDLTARYVWAGLDGGQWGKLTGGRVSGSSCSPTSATCLPPPMSPWRARPARWTPPRYRCSVRTVPCNTRTPSAIWTCRWPTSSATAPRISTTATTAPCATPSIRSCGQAGAGHRLPAEQGGPDRGQQGRPQRRRVPLQRHRHRYTLGQLMLGALCQGSGELSQRPGGQRRQGVGADRRLRHQPEVGRPRRLPPPRQRRGDGMSLRDTTLELQYKLTRAPPLQRLRVPGR